MTQYTHPYKRSQICGNFIDANGVEHNGNCQHLMQYDLPHCELCGQPANHSIHEQPEARV